MQDLILEMGEKLFAERANGIFVADRLVPPPVGV